MLRPEAAEFLRISQIPKLPVEAGHFHMRVYCYAELKFTGISLTKRDCRWYSLNMFDIVLPLLYDIHHIFRELGFELHEFFGGGMYKAQ